MSAVRPLADFKINAEVAQKERSARETAGTADTTLMQEHPLRKREDAGASPALGPFYISSIGFCDTAGRSYSETKIWGVDQFGGCQIVRWR